MTETRLLPALGLAASLLVALGAPAAFGQAAPVAADMTTETFKDWVVRCMPAAEGTQRLCEMTQELNDSQSGKRVLAIGIQRTASGDGLATIVAPLGLKLAMGVTLRGENDLALAAEFDTCLPAGCIARRDMDAGMIEALSATTVLTASMGTPDGQKLEVSLSPKGFPEAWSRLQQEQ